MIEDDETVAEMRSTRPAREAPRSFMSASEVYALRSTVLRVTQSKLAEQLISPDSGRPLTHRAISYWEVGLRPVPLWAARRIRDLAEAARRYDAKRGA